MAVCCLSQVRRARPFFLVCWYLSELMNVNIFEPLFTTLLCCCRKVIVMFPRATHLLYGGLVLVCRRRIGCSRYYHIMIRSAEKEAGRATDEIASWRRDSRKHNFLTLDRRNDITYGHSSWQTHSLSTNYTCSHRRAARFLVNLRGKGTQHPGREASSRQRRRLVSPGFTPNFRGARKFGRGLAGKGSAQP